MLNVVHKIYVPLRVPDNLHDKPLRKILGNSGKKDYETIRSYLTAILFSQYPVRRQLAYSCLERSIGTKVDVCAAHVNDEFYAFLDIGKIGVYYVTAKYHVNEHTTETPLSEGEEHAYYSAFRAGPPGKRNLT